MPLVIIQQCNEIENAKMRNSKYVISISFRSNPVYMDILTNLTSPPPQSFSDHQVLTPLDK